MALTSTSSWCGFYNDLGLPAPKFLVRRSTLHVDSFANKADGLSETLEDRLSRINTALDTRARQISETLVARTRDIASAFQDGQSEMSSALDDRLVQLSETLAVRAGACGRPVRSEGSPGEMRRVTSAPWLPREAGS